MDDQELHQSDETLKQVNDGQQEIDVGDATEQPEKEEIDDTREQSNNAVNNTETQETATDDAFDTVPLEGDENIATAAKETEPTSTEPTESVNVTNVNNSASEEAGKDDNDDEDDEDEDADNEGKSNETPEQSSEGSATGSPSKKKIKRKEE